MKRRDDSQRCDRLTVMSVTDVRAVDGSPARDSQLLSGIWQATLWPKKRAAR